MKLVNPTEIRHKIGMCPGCRDYLWAEVTVAVDVGTPTFTEEGKASVYANAKVVGMRLPAHECALSDDGHWLAPTPRTDHARAAGEES